MSIITRRILAFNLLMKSKAKQNVVMKEKTCTPQRYYRKSGNRLMADLVILGLTQCKVTKILYL